MQTNDGWRVEHLLDINTSRPDPTEQETLSMIGDIYSEWVDEEGQDDTSPDALMAWASARFSLDINSFAFDELDTNYGQRAQQIIKLQQFSRMHPNLSENEALQDKIIRVANVMRSAFNSLIESARLYHRMNPERELLLPNSCDLPSILMFSEDKLTNFQKLLIFFIKLLEIANYRKVDEDCWVQEVSSSGFPTQAWKKHMSIQEFLFKCITKEKCWDQWQYLTNPKDNAEHIVRHLVMSEQADFPSLVVERTKWSYDDGIYDVSTDTFWAYEEQDDWIEQGQRLQQYRRAQNWGDAYTITPPSASTMSVRYIKTPFRFRINPEIEATFDPLSIALPEMDTIFSSQNLSPDTSMWCLIMLARLFFKVGERDKWQVVFFIKGVAASGKSTLAKLIRYLYPGNLTSTLSANIEPKFGLSAIYKGLICVCAEVREDFGLNQADWQSAASGEEVSIAIKNKTAIQHLWDTQLFFLGNELPDYKNASGSVARRIFMIEFNNAIRNGGDPLLFEKLISNIDLFHRKSSRLYLDTVRKYGNRDIWDQSTTPKMLSDQIYSFKNNMRRGVDVLFKFLEEPCFEYGDEYRMSVHQFKQEYTAFRRMNGENGPYKWGPDHYNGCFQESAIYVANRQICGLRFIMVENEDEVE